MAYSFDWHVFLRAPIEGDDVFGVSLLSGLGWTCVTAFASWILAFLVGSSVGVIRTTKLPWLVRLGDAYVEVFRNIPLLVQMFLWFFVLPEVFPKWLGAWMKESVVNLEQPAFPTAVLCLAFFTSARVAEQVKTGILSLPRGQRLAATALGLKPIQVYAYVLLPVAYRVMIPPLTSELMNIIKNSSVALTIGLAELTFRAREIGEVTFQYFEAFTAATLIYVVVAMMANRMMYWLEKRLAMPGYIGSARS